MADFPRIRERSVAFFLLGVILLNPPLLSLFGLGQSLGGIPLLYLWLFGVWALLIALIGLTTREPPPHGGEGGGEVGGEGRRL